MGRGESGVYLDQHHRVRAVRCDSRTSGETRKESRIMKKGILPKLSLGLALAGACVLSQASRVLAAGELGDTVTFMEPARTLVMPFDETTNKKSFQIVTRIGGDDG